MSKSNIKQLIANLEKRMIVPIDYRSLTNKVGEYVVRNTKGKVRQRVSPNTNSAFPVLATGTIKTRDYLARYNTTSRFFRPTRSNLHITGQLIDSVSYAQERISGIRIFFAGDRTQYNGKNGQSIGKPISNQEVANNLRDIGFRILGLTPKMRTTIINMMMSNLRRTIKRRRK